MTPGNVRGLAAALLAVAAVAGCRSAGGGEVRTGAAPTAGGRADGSPAAAASEDSGRARHTAADVQFMTDMIAHHTQAVVMARWAATHEASPSIRTLAGRVVSAQQDEIAIMQQWLRDRGLPVPAPRVDGTKVKMVVDGVEHEHHMPGMLTEAQMAQLEAARGAEFDRLFLTFMIQHHRGAVAMVEKLVGSPGAAQDDAVFKIASDINVDQTTEIDRMQKMLAAMLFEPRTP